MASKSFFDVFKRYEPNEQKRKLLNSASDARFRYMQSPLRVEVDLYFDTHQNAELIYEIQDECRILYSAQSFKIMPHYPPSEFTVERFREVWLEGAMCGAVTYGFFNDAEYEDDGESINISIPFYQGGIDFITEANTLSILENILESRFGIRRRIKVVQSSKADDFEEHMNEMRRKRLEDAERESIERAKAQRDEYLKRQQEEQRANDPHYDFDSKVGISSLAGVNSVISENEYRMGATTYVTENSSVLYGEDFDVIEPTPLSDVESVRNNAVFLGTVFELTSKEARGGEKFTCTIGISDGACATYIRKFQNANEMDWFRDLKVGIHVAVLGRVKRDKFDNEPFVEPRGIKKSDSKREIA